MAITAPTERSMPPVAKTRVMPMERSITGAPRLMMSIRLPNSLPSLISRLMNPGVKRILNSRISPRATRGHNSLLKLSFFMRALLIPLPHEQ